MKKGLKTMNEKTMGAIPVSALERLEQSAVKLSLITFCLRHEELKAAPDAAEIHSIKSDLSRALQEVSANATACALSGGIPEKAKASPPAGAEPKRVQRKEIHKGTAYGVLRLRCPKCGDVFGRFLRETSASVTCRCGGEIIVSEYYQTSRDYKVLMNGKLSKRYIVTDAGPINSMTASCGSFCGAYWEHEEFDISEDGMFYDKKYLEEEVST